MEKNKYEAKEKLNIASVKYLLWDIDGTLLNFDLAEDIAIRTCITKIDRRK